MAGVFGDAQSQTTASGRAYLMSANGATQGNLVGDHMFAVTAVNAAAGTVTLDKPWRANAAGAGVAESFTASLSQLESEGVTFYNAVGKAVAA